MVTQVDLSVIVPNYNHGLFIDECLFSIFRQTFQNWECIIVDDGSTDQSLSAIQKWVEKDSRFTLLALSHNGVSYARNRAVERAKGAFITQVDADDFIKEDFLEIVAKELEGDRIDILYGSVVWKYSNRSKIDRPTEFCFQKQLLGNLIPMATIRKALWEKIGGYDEKMVFGSEDWEFWIRATAYSKNVCVKSNSSLIYFYRNRVEKDSLHELAATEENENRILEYIWTKHQQLYFDASLNYLQMIYKHNKAKRILESSRLYQYTKRFSHFLCKVRYGKDWKSKSILP